MYQYSLHSILIPSGKHTKNYGKSLFLMGKSTISMAISNSYVTNYQRVFHLIGIEHVIELNDGKIYRKALYLMVKTMVSCRFSLKPIH